MERTYEKWFSPALERDMELLRFGRSGYPVVTFPTSMGRFFQYEDTGLVGRLEEKIERGDLQLVCVDSVDAESWYNEAAPPVERGRRHERYDAYIRDEIVPYAQECGNHDAVGVFGCSFGAYHAANFAGRHPDVVSKAVCFSGVYDVSRFTDGYWDDTDYYNSPAAYIANMNAAWVHRLRGVEWIIATGEYDALAPDNRNFDAVLTRKGIPHHTEIWPGVNGHDWEFWNDAVVRLL
ncbi:MAG: esterase family protein [Candidatus Eremiobacteraeota bacterium]|nr:esterase family protein [Candidatus Eremiobacteraeota bacterium]